MWSCAVYCYINYEYNEKPVGFAIAREDPVDVNKTAGGKRQAKLFSVEPLNSVTEAKKHNSRGNLGLFSIRSLTSRARTSKFDFQTMTSYFPISFAFLLFCSRVHL